MAGLSVPFVCADTNRRYCFAFLMQLTGGRVVSKEFNGNRLFNKIIKYNL